VVGLEVLAIHMDSQVELFSIVFATKFAFMNFSFFFPMQFQVFCEVSILSKFFTSKFAVERLFACMNSHMIKQIPSLI